MTVLNTKPCGRHPPQVASLMLRWLLMAVLKSTAGRRLLSCMRLPLSRTSKNKTSPLPRWRSTPMGSGAEV